MDAGTATDDVTDAIAHIAMHRLDMEKEAGRTTACNDALRKLNELLKQEQEALQQHGPETRHPANIAAIGIEIKKVTQLMGATRQRQISRDPRPGQNQMSRRGGTGMPARNKGRRTMGRTGGR